MIKTILVEETAKMIVAARTIGKEAVITDKEIEDMNNLEIERYRKKLMKEVIDRKKWPFYISIMVSKLFIEKYCILKVFYVNKY